MGVPGEGGRRGSGSPPRLLGKHGQSGNIRLRVGRVSNVAVGQIADRPPEKY